MQEQVLFRLTGKAAAHPAEAARSRRLRPALFARFRDLARLRYDLPAVLVRSGSGGPFVRTLSSLVDDALREVAPRGLPGERMRRSALRVEREIRALAAAGERGTLSSMWERAAERVTVAAGADLAADLVRVRAAIRVDGDVVDCDEASAARIVEHAWRVVEETRAAALRRAIDDLVVRLSDLVSADLLRSDAGRDPAHLRAAIGAPHRDLFDFERMAGLIAGPSRGLALSEVRRDRIARVLTALRAHHALADDLDAYVFDDAEAALVAYRERLPAMAELVAAIAMGDLEVAGRYVESEHDGFFRGFDATALTPEDIALFPDVLVRLTGGLDPARHASIVGALTSGAPFKVLVETDDLFGMGPHLAAATMGLGDVFVLQAASSELVRLAAQVRAAIAHPGPALLSVFAPPADPGLPAYLMAAAATESRAFPTFTYDPSAEGGWSARLSLEGDPQPSHIWPTHDLSYADESMQRVTETVPFTLADLAICDPRRSRDLARLLPGAMLSGDLVSLGAWLEIGPAPSPTAVPYVNAIDADDRLVRLVVDDRLVRETRRSGEAWKRLVELAMPHASPSKPAGEVEGGRAVSREGAEPSSRPEDASRQVAATEDGASASDRSAKRETPEATSPAGVTAEAGISPDEAYIETVRCATCNECTNINPRMFKYNENKQAYIADLKAGTFKDLVEAAESCQVAIIHPGKPRDPNEPGLAELLERAATFA